jgi:hypothetical protein
VNGIVIRGPRGNVKVSNCTMTGGTAGTSAAVQIDAITTGIPMLDHISYTGGVAVTRARGLYVKSTSAVPLGSFVVTDSTFNVPVTSASQSAITQGFEVFASIGRIERCSFITQPGYLNAGGTNTGASTLELYGNYIFGAAGTTNSIGLENYGSTLYANGNTIDAGGSQGTNTSRGLWCDNSATTVFSSNSLGGGRSPNHVMAYGGNGTGCFTSASSNFDNNYFWYSATGGQSASDGVAQIALNANSSGNIIDTVGSTGCHDPLGAPPDYVIVSGTKCINAGLVGVRRDGTTITKDIKDLNRVLGTTADIGAMEKE